MQHLGIFEDAGIISSEKQGRVRTISLRPGALDVLHPWLGEQRTPAEHQADRLGIHLIRHQRCLDTRPTTRALWNMSGS